MNENNNFSGEQTTENGTEIDIMEIFQVIKSKILYIIAAALVFAIVAGVYFSNFVSPKYTSNARIYIDADYTEAEATLAISLATNFAKDYPYIIKSNNVIDKVAKNLELPVKGSQLMGAVNVTMPGEEIIRIIDISVTYSDPQIAADIANETIKVFSETLPEIAKYARIKIAVIDDATLPSAPSGPNVMRNSVLAAFIGALLTAAIFTVINVLNGKIKNENDIERYLGLNVLGMIPEYRDKKKKFNLRSFIKKPNKPHSKNTPIQKNKKPSHPTNQSSPNRRNNSK